ncbi:MAG: MATE family efflux transporter DinF [Gammaproteobacteria bacterium]
MQSHYSHRRVWHVAGPMIASNITVPLLGMVDTAVVGHLDTPLYLAAVAVGATIFSFLFLSFNFLRMGTTGVAAQAMGNNNHDAVRSVLLQAGVVALGIAAALLVLQQPLGQLALTLIDPEADVSNAAAGYFSVRIWAAPAVLLNYAIVGWFIGLQNGRAPLMIMLVVNVINIALDLLFVLQWGMAARGVAAASVVAEFCGLLLALWLVRRQLRQHPSDASLASLWDPQRLKRLLSVNGHLLVRSIALMFTFALFTTLGARQSSLILAANAVLLNFQTLMAYALDGFANAAEALIGRAIGANDAAGLRLAWRNTLIWSLGIALVFTVLYALIGNPLIHVMTDLDDVRKTAREFLPWLVVLPLASVWCFFYDGVFVGATRAVEMRNSMLLAAALFIPLAFGLLHLLGNHGLWLAMTIFMLARGIAQHLIWRRVAPPVATQS